jgi:hypothetical protein
MLRLEITDAQNQTTTNDFLIDSKKPGTYAEKVGLKTVTAWNCNPTQGKFEVLVLI